MNKHIYVMSYIGGFTGEFIASQISQDSNYKNLEFTVNRDNNRYYLVDELRENRIADLRRVIPSDSFNFSQEKRNLISGKINALAGNQNYIIPTHVYISDGHGFPIDPLRIKTSRIYADSFDFYFSLGILKTQVTEYDAPPSSLQELEMILLTSKDPSVISKGREVIENIKSRGHIYHIERLAFRHRNFSISGCLQAHYDRMKYINHSSLASGYKNWNHFFNLDDFYENHSSIRSSIRSFFNLSDDLNLDAISAYHQTNKDYLATTVNKNLQTFLSGDFISELSNYVKTKISSESTLD